MIFKQRLDIMRSEDLSEVISDMRGEVVDDLIDTYMPPNSYADQWDTAGLDQAVKEQLNLDIPVIEWCEEEGVDDEEVADRIEKALEEMMVEKTETLGPEAMRGIEKQLLLQTIDAKWREHLLKLEHLRSVVGFRGYAQRDPLNEYKNEAFQLFESMLDSLRQDVTQKLCQIRPMTEEEQQAIQAELDAQRAALAQAAEDAQDSLAPKAAPEGAAPGSVEGDAKTLGNPGRNAPCPCGSGKKFKHCHGRFA